MIDRLLKAGADANAPLSAGGDTALMMAARTGKTDAIRVLVEAGGNVNAKESWGGTTALMWAVSEGHADAARMLIGAGADVNARSNYVAAANGRGFEGRTPGGEPARSEGRGVRQRLVDTVDAGCSVKATSRWPASS
jgi:ankyrin repeat protein